MITETSSTNLRADRVAAWATGVGIGLVVFMVSWLVWNRVLSSLLSTPTGPVVAMSVAIFSGVIVTIRHGRRLAARFEDDQDPSLESFP